MLNELHDLAQCLKAVQVTMESWHPNFKTCPKGSATYLAFMNAESRIVDLQLIADHERIALLRKWEVEAGVSFPAFNVLPLFEPRGDETKKEAGELRKQLLSKSPPSNDEILGRLNTLVTSSESLWVKKEPARITKCLTTLAGQFSALIGEPPREFVAISELIARSGRCDPISFHESLQELLVQKIARMPGCAGEWFAVLFFYAGQTAKRLSIVLELSDQSQFPYPAASERVQAWVNSRLMAHSEEPNHPKATNGASHDAYANPAVRLEDSFPSVRLPKLGNVILRSMSGESPCQQRYGMADSNSFAASRSTRQEMKNALEWISHVDRREKTWCDVSSLNGTSGVLFAYPSQKPEMAPELAALVVGLDSVTDADGAKFEACASRVTRTLTELTTEAPATEVRVFVLAKPDGFRTKVLSSGQYNVNWLLECAAEWQRDARNLPTLKVRQFGGKKGAPPTWTDPIIPYPAEVVACLNTVWERAGMHAEQVHDFGISDGLGLLLAHGRTLHAIVMRAIRVLAANSFSLLLAMGTAHHQGLVHPLGKKYGKQAMLLPSILGLLLAKLGRSKGEYMKGPPFLVGRLLSLVDQLHVEYCLDERKGQIASQLIGSAMMPTAVERPEMALSLLCQRLPPYKNWATRLQKGPRVGLAKHLLGEIGRVCAQLKDVDLPSTCSDSDKAELLLGYLAWSEKQETTVPASEGVSA